MSQPRDSLGRFLPVARLQAIREAEVAIAGLRSFGRVDVFYENAAEQLRFVARGGQTAPEVCAAYGEPNPKANWETALRLLEEYARVVMRAAREPPAVSR